MIALFFSSLSLLSLFFTHRVTVILKNVGEITRQSIMEDFRAGIDSKLSDEIKHSE